MNNEQIFDYIKEYVNEPISQVSLFNDENDHNNELIINHLLSINNKEINDWLWNALEVKEDEYDINRSFLSNEGKAFVSKLIEAKRAWLKRTAIPHPAGIYRNILFNVNDDILGDRVILKPCCIKDNSDLYLHHVEVDGDFVIYVTPDHSNDNPASLIWANTLVPFSFYIYLKDTNEEIGVVSLCDEENKHHLRPLSNAYFHYYIYKEFRHKGYAYEASSLLIDAFFNRKLKNAVFTEKHYVAEEKACEPECIKLSTNAKNKASIALAEKLGFVYEGTDYNFKTTDGVPQDENSYVLTRERYFEIHRNQISLTGFKKKRIKERIVNPAAQIVNKPMGPM